MSDFDGGLFDFPVGRPSSHTVGPLAFGQGMTGCMKNDCRWNITWNTNPDLLLFRNGRRCLSRKTEGTNYNNLNFRTNQICKASPP